MPGNAVEAVTSKHRQRRNYAAGVEVHGDKAKDYCTRFSASLRGRAPNIDKTSRMPAATTARMTRFGIRVDDCEVILLSGCEAIVLCLE